MSLNEMCFTITNRQSLDDVNAKLEQQEQLLADNEKTGLNNVMCFTIISCIGRVSTVATVFFLQDNSFT